MKIGCYSYSNNDLIRGITWHGLEFYCKRHGYEFNGFTENIEKEYKPHWNKINYAIQLLREQQLDYFVWFDHDIVIKNFDIKLDDIIKKYNFDQSEAIFMVSEEVDNSIDPEPTESSKLPFNTGVIVFKNNPKTLSVFESLLSRRTCPADFQNGFQDTKVFLDHYTDNPKDFLRVPHRVLQSNASHNHLNCYEEGDFCGHVSGDQGVALLIGLNDLIDRS